MYDDTKIVERLVNVCMNNLILFTNTFLSYLVVMAVIVIVAFVAMVIGIKWRKAKDAKTASLHTEEE